MTYIGFEAMYIAPKVETMRMRLVPTDGEPVPLAAKYLGKDPEDPGRHVFGGEAHVAALGGRSFHAVAATADGAGGFAAPPLDERYEFPLLDPTSADTVEPFLGAGRGLV